MKHSTNGRSRTRAVIWLLALLFACIQPGVNRAIASPSNSSINLDHFNHLYDEIRLADKTVGIVHIYSTYPDYPFAIEPEEGFTCIDDVARAIVMLSQLTEYRIDTEIVRKIKMLVEFVLHMQNENGYFNNFLWNDYSINEVHENSVAELNWWSLRALWSLETAYPILSSDTELTTRIDIAIGHLVANIKRDLPVKPHSTEVVNTIGLPNWLPHKFAADQAAVLMLGLLPHYLRTGDNQALALIHEMATGITRMQKGGPDTYPYGMFLSWKNSWHAWGNSQSYALLLAGQALNSTEYIRSALIEIENFYPYMLANGFADAIFIEATEGGYSELTRTRFPQIAYGIRPMVYASAEAYRATGNRDYLKLARKLRSWFLSGNDANKLMYSRNNGMTYDAIVSTDEINLNSGAESTIEGLMVMQKDLFAK